MVRVQCNEDLGKVDNYIKAIFKEYEISDATGDDNYLIKIGMTEDIEVQPNSFSIPDSPKYWLTNKKREARLANWLKIAAAFAILDTIN